MKNKKLAIVMVILCSVVSESYSQSINWESLKKEQTHILNVNAGWDYGFVYGTGYSYQLKSKMPVLLNASYSFPSGENLFDEFKTKIGSQIRLYRFNNFQVSASVYGIYRRYENPLVRLQNFGSEISGVIGYYKAKWYVAAEFGFDKAIVTHFKHSTIYKDIYPLVKDGWYIPATGGNFNYGLQTGISFKQSDITLRIGKVMTQDFKTTPLIPYYAQLGYNLKINGRKN